MEENQNNLEMDLFGADLELNMGINPDDLEENNISEDDDSSEDNKQNNLSEEQNDQDDQDEPEDVSEEDQNDEGNNIEEDDDNSSNLYSSFASLLNEQGLLPSLDLEKNNIENIDQLTEAFKDELNNQAKQYIINKVGEQGYDALEKGVSLAQYQQHQNDSELLDSVEEEDLTNDLELAKKVILQDYVSQGIAQDKALRFLKKSIDLGDESVIEDAKQSLESLKLYQEKSIEKLKADNQLNIERQQAQQEKIDNDLKNSIYTKKEIIEGVKLNKSIQDNIYKSITQIVGTDPNTGISENQLMKDRRENPIEFDTKLYYLYEITKGFSDFSKIVAKSKSKASNDLEKALRKNKSMENIGNPGYLNDPDSYGGIGTEIVF